MQIKKILSDEEIRKIEEIIHTNYGCWINLQNMFITRDDKLWIAGKDINLREIANLKNCHRIGIYFGKLKRNNKIKLSIEGAMMIGEKAVKNVARIDDKEAINFIQGYDVNKFKNINCEKNNFVIVKNGDDVLGVGILRDDYIENLISKARRIKI